MSLCCNSTNRRRGLLSNLKSLVDAIDDRSYCSPPCNPCYAQSPCCIPLNPCEIPPQCHQESCIPYNRPYCSPYIEECCPPPRTNNYQTCCKPIPCPEPCPSPNGPIYTPNYGSYIPYPPPNPISFKQRKITHCTNFLPPVKSRELINGVLYSGCLCNRRNGLQDDCPRTECRGRPECLTLPYPICRPSRIDNDKLIYSTNECFPEYQCLCPPYSPFCTPYPPTSYYPSQQFGYC